MDLPPEILEAIVWNAPIHVVASKFRFVSRAFREFSLKRLREFVMKRKHHFFIDVQTESDARHWIPGMYVSICGGGMTVMMI